MFALWTLKSILNLSGVLIPYSLFALALKLSTLLSVPCCFIRTRLIKKANNILADKANTITT